jgi:hypothetical protein
MTTKEPLQDVIKILNIQNKERRLKAAIEVTYKGKPITITADFPIETSIDPWTE